MWEIDNGLQIIGFLRSAAAGGIYCLVYDLLRAFRKACKPTTFTVFLQDILYFTIISPITFCLLLALTNGELRFYVFAGIIFGFTVVRLTLSRLTLAIFYRLFLALEKVLDALKKLIDFLSVKLTLFSEKISKITKKIFLNIRKSAKKA